MSIHAPDVPGKPSWRERLAALEPPGVRAKILAVLTATLLLTLTVTNAMTLADQRRELLANISRQGHLTASLVADDAAYSVAAYDYHTLELLAHHLVGHGLITHLVIINNRSHVMAEAGTVDRRDARRFVAPIELGGQLLGVLTLDLSTRELNNAIARNRAAYVRRQMISIAVIATIELTMLSLIILRPLRRMTDVLEASDPERPETLADIPVVGRDEFATLARKYNGLRARLMARIDLSNQELRRVNAQLAHQADELTRVNTQLTRLSITDPLTGLHNRRHFELSLAVEVELSLRSGAPTSLILLDLDRFKPVNDIHGHAVGDEVLRHVARLLETRTRRTDVVGRFGGDEFYILARRTDRAQAEVLARGLQKTLAREPYSVAGAALPVGVSIGVATIPGRGSVHAAHDLFLQADKALYAAKNSGRELAIHYDALTHLIR